MAEIVWSPRAIKDIDEIATYIAKDSLQYAEAQVSPFFSTASILERYPYRGRIVPELAISGIRQLLCGHHQSRLLKNNVAIKRRLRRAGKK